MNIPAEPYLGAVVILGLTLGYLALLLIRGPS